MRVWLCVCWSLCCCDAQMLALRRSLWGYCPRSRGASTVPRLDRQPSVLAVGRALRSLLLSATVAAPRSPCCLLLCLCSFVSTVLVSVCPGVGVNIFEEVGWFRPPKISKDMSTGKPIKRAYFQPRRLGEENFRPYTFSHASFGYDLVSVHACHVNVQVQHQTVIRENSCQSRRRSAPSDVTAIFICTLKLQLGRGAARRSAFWTLVLGSYNSLMLYLYLGPTT